MKKITSYISKLTASFIVTVTLSAGTVSAWDFDQTRARDIVDRAANDGDHTAQLLLALAIDDRVRTNFDDYPFRLPTGSETDDHHVRRLEARHIYRNLMTGTGEGASKESLMVYALWGTYALADGQYSKASMYYGIAEALGENLIEEHGLNPDLSVLLHDAKAGKVASMRCEGRVPEQTTTYKIDKMLAGLERMSGIARDYREYIQAQIPITRDHPRVIDLKGSGCWAAPLAGASIVVPLAPYNYEQNSAIRTSVLK